MIARTNSSNQNIDPDRSMSLNYAYNQPGSMPGTIAISAQAKPSEITLIDYNQERHHYASNLTPEECRDYLTTKSISWVDVGGLGDRLILEKLGEVFDLHPVLLENIVNVPQRPKLEDYQNQLVVITQMVNLDAKGVWLEQVSFILGENYLLTVQEEPHQDCFTPVRDRLAKSKGIIRQQQADYLTYALWDAVIDSYFPVLEVYGEKIEELEQLVLTYPTQATLGKIHQIKRELLSLRRAVWPQRDILNLLIRDGHPLIGDHVLRYLKDCYDHTVQIIDTLEIYRELASGLMDVYLSAVSNKMNQVMKLLAVISTVFIPLTFVAGIYGMNFNTEISPWNMPELNFYWGYPLCIGIMLAIALSLIIYFWRLGWLKSDT
ncbi:MAG: magnesium/cobalt transporter CorA [Pleurocapsa sp. SU_5_0]|nr:magnesium/cobalt transporter CorA [Pleurocapsa sp. SU_5_0]NJO95680.1 magnesium/cobalt transporter CorA [Pleurocapsa sp. CRU_1_2]NJR44735.1 magnesium/cobalt transporter CorA [Hyellaceae cyanobacterium CSU_1_1]